MEKAIPNPTLFIFRKLLHWTFRLEEAFVSSSTDELLVELLTKASSSRNV